MDEWSESKNPPRSEHSRLTREQGHAFANIFSVIIANAEIIGEKLGATAQIQRQLERIITASHRGDELVRRIRNNKEPDSKHNEVLSSGSPCPVVASGRILVVDDEGALVEIISHYLLKEGHDVQAMTDSRQALERFHADPLSCDLLITDRDMPVLNGTELCRRIHEIRPDLPIIMISGHDYQLSGFSAVDLGIRELLMKPLDRQALLTAVRRLLKY